jgi:predicted oxidoreductase (fatty acid repression mutant protein)
MSEKREVSYESADDWGWQNAGWVRYQQISYQTLHRAILAENSQRTRLNILRLDETSKIWNTENLKIKSERRREL